jgi:class 3 adenylate cyclase
MATPPETPEPESTGRRWLEAARRVNHDPRLLELAQRARRRTIGDDAISDPLAQDRGRAADLAAQHLADLRGDAPGVLGELGMSALQTWQRIAERQDRGRGRVDVAVMFTDLVGFSAWALEAGDQAAIELLREFTEASEPPILERRGEVVKRLGDGVMAAFWDAPSAVEAAFEAAERAASIEVEGYRARLRTGIHLGRPRRIGDDYFGVDVNIAARLAEQARPGEILVSDTALAKLDETAVWASKRRFRAKGAPADLGAHAIERLPR